MNRIRAVFFDIDGTLVGFKHKVITDRTIAALQKLRDQGILLIIASGRPRNLILNLKDYPFDGYITMNGTYVTYGDEVLLDRPIEKSQSALVARISDEKGFPCVAFSADVAAINFENEITARLNKLLNIGSFPIMPMEEFAEKYPVYQYTVYVTPEDQETYFSRTRKGTVWHRWHPEMADSIPVDASKAVAVEAVLKHLGISREETLSFGDGGNDMAMLQSTGIGVAMGNAMDEVKEIADFVTKDADEDGIVHALEHFGLIV